MNRPRFTPAVLPALIAILTLVLASGCRHVPRQPYMHELRGVWLTNVDSDVLTSREKIAEAMEYLASININVVYPVVWNKSLTMYPSGVMRERFGVEIDPIYQGRDPLAELIVEAHRHGIEVIPWFEYGFASSYQLGGGPILERYPHWAAIDRHGNLVEKNGFEWLNAFDPEVQDFVSSLVLEVAANYDIDGIQGDDRLPAIPSSAGYDLLTRERYRAQFGTDPPQDEKNEQWIRWRAEILNNFLAKLHRQVKEIDSNLIVSMSPSYYDWSLYEYLQDSKSWVDRGLVDTIHPQAYRYNVPAYQGIVDDLVTNQFTPEQLSMLAPGVLISVGDYLIPTNDLLASIAYNRANGINGEVFFFYEGLRREENRLGDALGAGPYVRPALVPYRTNEPWRPPPVVVPVGDAALQGNWALSEEFPHLFENRGGEGRVVYTLSPPHSGVYDVYTYLPLTDDRVDEVSYTFARGTRGAEAMPLDLRSPLVRGWVHIGRFAIEAGRDDMRLVLNVLSPTAGQRAFAGPVMLRLNRRHSPEVNWN